MYFSTTFCRLISHINNKNTNQVEFLDSSGQQWLRKWNPPLNWTFWGSQTNFPLDLLCWSPSWDVKIITSGGRICRDEYNELADWLPVYKEPITLCFRTSPKSPNQIWLDKLSAAGWNHDVKINGAIFVVCESGTLLNFLIFGIIFL